MTRYIDLPWECRLDILSDIRALGGRIAKGCAGRGLVVWCPDSPPNITAMINAMSERGFTPEGRMDHDESGHLIKFVPLSEASDGNLYDRPPIPGKGRVAPAFRGDEPQPDQDARKKL